MNQNAGTAIQQLDRELLAAWLNFANGAFDLNELVDTDGNGTDDTRSATVMANAEAVRLNPASTEAQMHAQRNILQRINGSCREIHEEGRLLAPFRRPRMRGTPCTHRQPRSSVSRLPTPTRKPCER